MKLVVRRLAVVIFVYSGLSAQSAQQGYPPDTQAQSSQSSEQAEPQQTPNAEQQTEPPQAQPQNRQPQDPESQQAEPQQAPAQPQPQQRPQPQPRTTQRQSQAPRTRTQYQQQTNGLDIQGITLGEVTIGGGTIGKLRQDWQSAWNSRRLDDLMGLYSDDAVLLVTEGQRIMGKQAIRDYFQQVLVRGKNQVMLNSLSTYPADRLAYDDGTFRETLEPGSGSETGGDAANRQVRGNYLTVIGRSGDGWLIREQAIYGLR